MYYSHDYCIIILNQNNRIESYNAITVNLFPNIREYEGRRLKTFFEALVAEGMIWEQTISNIIVNSQRYKVLVERFIGDPICNQVVTIIPLKSIDSTIYYRSIIDTIPDAIIIVQDSEIKLANKAALKLVKNIEGNSITEFLRGESDIARKRIEEVIRTKTVGKPIDYTVHGINGKIYVVEVVSAYIEFNAKPAVLTIARDITIKKEDLKDAARVQKILLKKKIPIFESILLRTIYIPSKTVSGDFYFFEKHSEGNVLGILGDVKGKGITAALKISAFEVIFREVVQKDRSFEEMVRLLNKKVAQHFDDFYVACLIFLIDKINQRIYISGAGINEFIRIDNDNHHEKVMLRGPFLGMFDDVEFDKTSFDLKDFSRLLFYSDGFEETILSQSNYQSLLIHGSIFDIIQKVQIELEEKLYSIEGLHDDSTLLVIDLNYEGVFKEYRYSGLMDYTYKVQEILDDINLPEFEYVIKLIIIELMTNAFKYGNQRNTELPILVRYTYHQDSLILEVSDMGLTQKDFKIKSEITNDDLMDESGRGLFIIDQLSKSVCTNGNTVTVELEIGGM